MHKRRMAHGKATGYLLMPSERHHPRRKGNKRHSAGREQQPQTRKQRCLVGHMLYNVVRHNDVEPAATGIIVKYVGTHEVANRAFTRET